MSDATRLLVLTAADVRLLFDMDAARESQHTAFEQLGLGHAQLPARLLLDGPRGSASFCYASRVSDDTGSVCKFGSTVPDNADRGLPTVSALVTALDPQTGQPAAIMDGTTVTTLRTAAASAVAAQCLANPGSGVLAILGSGVQADAHARALARVLPLRTVRIWSPDAARRNQLAGRLAADHDFEVTAAADAQSAVAGADVVVACTTSSTPILAFDWLERGATVISVGSFAADRCEVAADLLVQVDAVVVDDVLTSLEHAGPVVAAVAEGAFTPDRLVSLGSVVAGRAVARRTPQEIVYYNSVGIGVQDAAAAWAIITAAREQGVGQSISI